MKQTNERPVLFSTPLVRAIRDGRKDVTRRLVDKRLHIIVDGDETTGRVVEQSDPDFGAAATAHARCPYGAPGDRLWLQEAHTIGIRAGSWVHVTYHADGFARDVEVDSDTFAHLRSQVTVQKQRGRPGRFMPRWASRLLLDVVDTRCERLHEITEEDAIREGVRPFFETLPGISRDQCLTTGERAADAEHRAGFALLWDELNGDRALWKDNPWIWRVEFRRVDSERCAA